MPEIQITFHKNYSRIAFQAMASPCEVLIRSTRKTFCEKLAKLIIAETRRIENKFSRYIEGNLVSQMNHSNNEKVVIDQETFQLLEYAKNLFELSDGLFDITSGVLREIWHFTENSQPPSAKEITAILEKIGFQYLSYSNHSFRMPTDMQIDFGGIGKEYAVDQVTNLVAPFCQPDKVSYLVNFGGDLTAVKLKENDPPWVVGLESAKNHSEAESVIKISQGSVATSGNTKRFLKYNGKVYGHLLNPKTGYPIEGAPQSITAFSDSCILAGSYSSLAMLQGSQAESFLVEQQIKHRCLW